MLLKDLLTKEIVDDLNKMSVGKKNKKSKKKNYKSKLNNGEKKNLNKKNKANEVKNTNKVNAEFESDLDFKYVYKKHYIDECPHCSCRDLELTGNGYYYCENCGIKVDKKFLY